MNFNPDKPDYFVPRDQFTLLRKLRELYPQYKKSYFRRLSVSARYAMFHKGMNARQSVPFGLKTGEIVLGDWIN